MSFPLSPLAHDHFKMHNAFSPMAKVSLLYSSDTVHERKSLPKQAVSHPPKQKKKLYTSNLEWHKDSIPEMLFGV